jgi:hypothetical protein
MGDSSVQVPEIILVLCHSFFHNAFRVHRPVDAAKFKIWSSSRFVANFIIEKQAELPEGSSFAVTSKQVFDSFALKFHGEKPSVKQRETVDILRNSIYVLDHPSVNKLSIDDSVLVICDTLYSRSNYAPILVTNIPKKIEKAEKFYHKKDSAAEIPYPIYNVVEAESFLRDRYTELCRLVDNRIRNSIQRR